MRPFMVNLLKKYHPNDPWEGIFFSRLTPQKQTFWNTAQKAGTSPILCIDYYNLADYGINFRDDLANELGGDIQATHTYVNCIKELQNARNKCQHYNVLDEFETDRAYSNMIMIANMLKLHDLRFEIIRLRNMDKAPAATPVAKAQPTIPQPAVTTTTNDENGTMLTSWFNNVLPHYDIRSGVLDESVFAANLNEVSLGTGPEVYNNASSFFAKTYVTEGLRDIANRVVKALNGEETNNRVISLQTGFGGGKTHTLISIYHIVKSGAKLLDLDICKNILNEGVVPKFSDAKVAVFTNNTNDVSQGRTIEGGITIYTLWGEIAYQLGGKDAYEKIKQNDIERTAPTATILKPIIEEAGTSLILIDELADYCVKATSKKVGAGTLFVQTNSFMQTLTEVVSSVPKCVLIATLPASATEVASTDIGQTILESLQTRIVRVGTNVKPVDDEEIFEVVRRRLFEQINDERIVSEVTDRYKSMFHNRRMDLPDYCDRAEYANKIRKSYPFHPELIEMFRQRWGSDSRFQRTRGVLRLLASIVQDLWKRRDSLTGSQALIHTSDVNLENTGSLTGTITNLMGSQWETVMMADVYGSSSNARKIDEADPTSNIGHYHLTQGIATTLLMASVGIKKNKGLDLKQLKLCVLRPKSFNHNDVNGALNKLEEVAHYLYSTKVGGATYWFESRANINILISQARSEVKDADIEAEILSRLNSSKAFIHNLKVLINPTTDIVEQKELTLVVLRPSLAVSISTKLSYNLEDTVKTIATKRGNSDRIMRNTIFYLACSEVGKSALYGKIREYLACKNIMAESGGRLEPDQKIEIQNKQKDSEKQVNEALIRAYSIALRYSAKDGISQYEMKDYATDFSSQIQINLIKEIIEEEWIVKSVGRNVLSINNLLPTVGKAIPVKDVYEAFLRFDDKPMLLNADAIKTTVNRYCVENVFNVASGKSGNYTKIYQKEEVPFLDVTSEDYWLVDTSIVPADPKPATGNEGNGGIGTSSTGTTSTGGTTTTCGGTDTTDSNPKKKNYKKVVISGQVPVENYSQLFSSFINTLKNNNLKIEIKLTAKSTITSELNESSQIIKSVKESASQLGLDFETEN